MPKSRTLPTSHWTPCYRSQETTCPTHSPTTSLRWEERFEEKRWTFPQSTVLPLGPDRPPWQEVSWLLLFVESANKLTLTIEKFFCFGAVGWFINPSGAHTLMTLFGWCDWCILCRPPRSPRLNFLPSLTGVKSSRQSRNNHLILKHHAISS